MYYPFHSLPVYLLLLVAQWLISPVEVLAIGTHSRSSHRLPRLVRRAHASAVGKTHSLARDLRLAFSHVLPRDEGSENRPVVYCKTGQQPLHHHDGNEPDSDSGTPPPSDDSNSTTTTTRRGNSGSESTATPGGSTRTSSAASGGNTQAPRPPNSPWRLANTYQGSTFFRGWDFFTAPDPTHGIVDYIDEAAGRSAGLVDINNAGNAIMRVETTPTVPGNRRSIRITTQRIINRGGLVILDAVHMPVGCGTWPAFWTNGPDWPRGGEIDILEGVHQYTNNQATLHTSAGCRISSTSSDTLRISGRVIAGTNCDVGATSNQGCGIRANSPLSYGKGFNENGGGVYAMQWDADGIAIFFFPRGLIPDDIVAEAPRPDSWGAAQARWPADGCDPFQFFRDQHVIFDTTLCGDWAGGVWDSAGIPGQEESCAQRTGFRTCQEYVRQNGAAFNEAYWEVRSVKIYDPR